VKILAKNVMAENIIIPNPENLEKMKKANVGDGAEKLHVLADFDKTLTRAFINGKSIVSLISILRDGSYLTPDYAAEAHALYNKYHPMEIDPSILAVEKKKLMHEWWSAHFKLLIESGLKKRDLKKAVESGKIELREGFGDFVEILRANDIPLVILSSSGLGVDGISMYLEKEGEMHDNIYIASNSFKWDKNGNAIGVKEPIIHSFNKFAPAIKNFPFYSKIKNRKNVILLGDSVEDADMVQGFDYDNLIKIGFLSENIEDNIERYKKAYDVIILNDGSMEYINELVKEIII